MTVQPKLENASVVELLIAYEKRQILHKLLEVEGLRYQLGLRGPFSIADLMALQNLGF